MRPTQPKTTKLVKFDDEWSMLWLRQSSVQEWLAQLRQVLQKHPELEAVLGTLRDVLTTEDGLHGIPLTLREINDLKDWKTLLLCRTTVSLEGTYFVQEPFWASPTGRVAFFEADGLTPLELRQGFGQQFSPAERMRVQQSRFKVRCTPLRGPLPVQTLSSSIVWQLLSSEYLVPDASFPAKDPRKQFHTVWKVEHPLPGERWEDNPNVYITNLTML